MPRRLNSFERQQIMLRGADEIADFLSELSPNFRRKAMAPQLEAAAERIRRRAEAIARAKFGTEGKPKWPQYGGHLANQIIKTKPRVGKPGGSCKVGPAKDAFWGLFQEFGTKHQGPKPFLTPAFDAEARPALDVLMKGIWEWFEQQKAKPPKG